MKTHFMKLLCLVLTIVLLVNMLPMSVFAAEFNKYQTAKTTVRDVFVLSEITENRTEYSKEFRLSNGLNLQTVYSAPVHYEVDGQWQEIDNTLKSATTKAGSVYQNTAGIWQVSLPQGLTEDNGVTITKDGYTLNFRLSGELVDAPDQDVIELPVQPGEELVTEEAVVPTASETEAAPTADPIAATEVPNEDAVADADFIPVENIAETAAQSTEPAEDAIEPTAEAATADATEMPTEAAIEAPAAEIDLAISESSTADPVAVAIDAVMDSNVVLQAPAERVNAKIEKIDLAAVKAAEEHPETIADKVSSRLRYNDIYEKTDIIFDLDSNMVKESIVMEEYNGALRGYSYILNVGEMTPVLNENNEVELRDKTGKNVIMVMPAPFLVDQTGYINYDVEVSLQQMSSGTYLLIYDLPQEWLADDAREWPVVLDPAVLAKTKVSNIQDVSVYTVKETENNNLGILSIGKYQNDGLGRAYLKYKVLPELAPSDVIVSADFRLYKPYGSSSRGERTIEIHKVEETWDVTNLTWAGQPDFDPLVEDYVKSMNKGFYNWDVTNLVRSWYADGNYGMVLKFCEADEDPDEGLTWQQFYSSDYGSSTYMPNLSIYFRNNTGVESYWNYTASSAGRAGAGYVNQYSGNLTWVRGDIGFGGNRMPVSISHVYNSNDNTKNEFGMGYGWRTNFNQRVYKWDNDDAATTYYVWEDGDGTPHYFYYYSSSTYKDEDGLELTLKTNGSGAKKYSIKDKNGNCSYFDTYGRLRSQENNQETKSNITITYTNTSGLKIQTITDGVGRKYNFTYTDNLLDKISFVGKGTTEISSVSFGYDNSKLTSVTDADNKASQFGYGLEGSTTDYLLTSAQDIDGYKVCYTYTNHTAGKPARVQSISEFDGTVAGGELNFEYGLNQTKITDHDNHVQILQFNNCGNVISIQDDQGHAQYAQYAINGTDGEETDSTAKGNQLRVASKLQNTVGNLFRDSSFEDSALWTTQVGITATIDSSAAFYGNKSMKLENSSTDAAATISSLEITVPAGAAYTFSAYVKTAENSTAKLGFVGSQIMSEVLSASQDWTRLEVNYTNTTEDEIIISPQVLVVGTCYIDCVQAELAPTASRYNLIQNGNFSFENYAWSSDTGRETTSDKAPALQLDNNVYKMTGNYSTGNSITQTVQVSGAANDTYVLSGWAKGDSVPIKDNRKFALIATFNNTDDTTTECVVNFNPCAHSSIEWQYAAAPVVAEKAYDSITVTVSYDENANTMRFDGIQLFKEAYGSSYTYDEDGNIVSVKDLRNQQTTYEYASGTNDLLTANLPNGGELTYTYDDYHNVETATSEDGSLYSFEYDEYGNNTTVSIVDGNVSLTSSVVYTADGNRQWKAVDAAGKTTEYSYNEQTNILEWVKYPNDTDATKTTYTYDNMYRLASTAATTDIGNLMSASYTYEDDLLTSIETPTTTYTFAYGNFALRSQVKVGSRTLATYTYTGRNNDLQRLDYGNGDYVQYEYNEQGQITKETFEDGSTLSYKYDNNGVLATVADSATGRTATYYYDFTDRLMRYVENGNGFEHTVGYEYDTINNLTKLIETINGVASETTYEYDKDNRITGITTNLQAGTEGTSTDGSSRTYSYDAFSRIESQTTKHNGTEVLEETFTYHPNGTNTTGQVDTYKITTANGTETEYGYSYDNNGNISMITVGLKMITYKYDSANQLIREDNELTGTTTTWEYDSAGNILNRKEYLYTTDDVLGTPRDTVTYTYGDATWGDLLTAYNGQTISYDAIGNPLSDGTWNYTWQHGRQMAAMSKADGSVTWTNSYTSDGLRTQRTNGTTTYAYVYSGDKLGQMTVGNNVLRFAYDASGKPMSVDHNGIVYYYLTNLQGDVTGIVDANGANVASYVYDAWGNILNESAIPSGIGQLNPLRYRGYVYDNETGLYYVSSRYYDPEIGRWINADSQLNTSLGVLGCNMFAYCLNNPVNKVDYGGNKPGDLFDTMDEAAKDAAEYLGELTWENTWEYSTAIYTVNTTVKTYETVTKTHRFLWWTWTTTSTKTVRTKVKKYTYKAVKTDKKNNSVGVPNAPLFKKRVAALHTHPMGSWAGITRFSDADKKWADYYKIPLYVHGPNGELRKYDPASGEDILIYSDLPISPKTPWLE